jgi:hypothetical protein
VKNPNRPPPRPRQRPPTSPTCCHGPRQPCRPRRPRRRHRRPKPPLRLLHLRHHPLLRRDRRHLPRATRTTPAPVYRHSRRTSTAATSTRRSGSSVRIRTASTGTATGSAASRTDPGRATAPRPGSQTRGCFLRVPGKHEPSKLLLVLRPDPSPDVPFASAREGHAVGCAVVGHPPPTAAATLLPTVRGRHHHAGVMIGAPPPCLGTHAGLTLHRCPRWQADTTGGGPAPPGGEEAAGRARS